MNFVCTCTLLAVGSGLMTFRIPERVKPLKEHLGIILMIYSFVNLVVFTVSSLGLISTEPLFFMMKSGLWNLLLIIGYQLAYPVLSRTVFSRAADLESQGQLVFDNFNAIRILLGLAGFAVMTTMILIQTGVV